MQIFISFYVILNIYWIHVRWLLNVGVVHAIKYSEPRPHVIHNRMCVCIIKWSQNAFLAFLASLSLLDANYVFNTRPHILFICLKVMKNVRKNYLWYSFAIILKNRKTNVYFWNFIVIVVVVWKWKCYDWKYGQKLEANNSWSKCKLGFN